VFDVSHDVGAFANAAHGRDESDGCVGLDHSLLLCCVRDFNMKY
jgi:hypothetical protein